MRFRYGSRPIQGLFVVSSVLPISNAGAVCCRRKTAREGVVKRRNGSSRRHPRYIRAGAEQIFSAVARYPKMQGIKYLALGDR
jgi:hypothetical protein